LIFVGISSSFAQTTISKSWSFEAVTDTTEISLFNLHEEDYLILDNGSFEYSLGGENISKASGDYVYQNEVILFLYDSPKDSIQDFRVTELTDSTLVLAGSNKIYTLKETPESLEEVLPVETAKELIP